MSTKIYNGYKIKNVDTFSKLEEFIQRVKKEILHVYNEEITQLKANICTKIIDELSYFKEESYESLKLSYAPRHKEVWEQIQFGEKLVEHLQEQQVISPLKKVDGNLAKDFVLDNVYFEKSSVSFLVDWFIKDKQNEIKLTQRRDPLFDFEFSLHFLPIENDMLVLLYTENKRMRETWEAIEGVEYYGYWNNVDPEEGVTDEDWEQRKSDWDKAFHVDYVPAEQGFHVEIVRDLLMLERLDISNFIPAFEDRVNKMAKRVLEKEINQEIPNNFFEEHGMSAFLEEVATKKNSPEGKRRFQELVEEMETILIPVIDNTVLRKDIKDIAEKDIK